MIRALTTATVLALAVPSVAQAADPYMWGVGPRLGTTFLPGAYPAAFPRLVADDRQAADRRCGFPRRAETEQF